MHGVTHAFNMPETDSQWVGLIMDGQHAWEDAQQMCQILGTGAALVTVRDGHSPLTVAQDLMRTRATSMLALLRAGQADRLDQVLAIARTFSSFRRIVVLRLDGDSLPVQSGSVPVLSLQDSPAVRRALAQFIHQEERPAQTGADDTELPSERTRASA